MSDEGKALYLNDEYISRLDALSIALKTANEQWAVSCDRIGEVI